jgi:hypothetical protein
MVPNVVPASEATAAIQNPRKHVYVSGRIQGSIVKHAVFYWAVYHLILWHILFMYRYLQYRAELIAGGSPSTFWDLYSQFSHDNIAVILCALPILPVLVWDVVRVTHRVAGPLVRFRECLKALSRGEHVPFVRIRKGDYLVDMERAFNEYLATLPEPILVADGLSANGSNVGAAARVESLEQVAATGVVHTPAFIACGEPGVPCDHEADTLIGPTFAELEQIRAARR